MRELHRAESYSDDSAGAPAATPEQRKIEKVKVVKLRNRFAAAIGCASAVAAAGAAEISRDAIGKLRVGARRLGRPSLCTASLHELQAGFTTDSADSADGEEQDGGARLEA